MILTILITALVVFTIEEYHHSVIKPVRYEQYPAGYTEWKDFITANINSAMTEEHCKICAEMIALFRDRFSNEVYDVEMESRVRRFWNMLDTRQKALEAERSLLSVDQNGNLNLKKMYDE